MKFPKTPSFVSEPQIQYLEQLLDEVRRGNLQVPRFQRPFVWDTEKRLELVRSIRDGIPIGTIMVWRTNRSDIRTYDLLGPYRLSPPAFTQVQQYLLDGVQRLSTLFGALNTVDPELDEAEAESATGHQPAEVPDSAARSDAFALYFDLETKEFLTGGNDGDEVPRPPEHLPLSIILNSVALLRFQRNLKGTDNKQTDAWVKRADEISRSFREYKIPIIPIATDDIEMATRTFQRINSQGTVMSELHMLNALTWSKDFNLLDQVFDLKARFLAEGGWDSVDDDLVVKTCKAGFSLDLYDADVDDLSKKIAGDPSALERAVSSIAAAAKFLGQDCGVRGPATLPYSLQLVLLADVFRTRPKLDELGRKLLRDWFWMTTYSELFASISGGRLKVVLETLHKDLKGKRGLTWPTRGSFRRRVLPFRFDFRSARAKALVLRIADASPVNLRGERIDGHRLLAEHGAAALLQLIPRHKLAPVQFASPANRVLADPVASQDVREAVLTGKVDTEFLAGQVVSPAALEALLAGKHQRFIELRTRDLNAREEQFLEPVRKRLS